MVATKNVEITLPQQTSTPSPAPSRRSFIGQVAVATAGLTGIVASRATSAANLADPDAHLAALLMQWRTLQERDDDLDCREDETFFACHDAIPIPPEIRSREPDPVSGRFSIRDRRILEQVLERRIEPEPGLAKKVRRRLALHDDYEARIEAEMVRNGHAAIETERAGILAECRQIEAEIECTPAAGLAGIAIKLFILFQTGPYGVDFNGDADPETRMLLATVRDAERLAGLPFSIVDGALTGEA